MHLRRDTTQITSVQIGSTSPLEDQILHINDSRQGPLLFALIFIVVLSSAAVALRLLARRLVKVPLGYDDWFVLLAQAFAFASLACCVQTIRYGFGKHTIAADLDNVVALEKMHYVLNILYSCALLPTKIAIVLFYRRIFPTQGFRRMANAMLALLVCAWLALSIPAIFVCTPISFYWNKEQDGTCINEYRLIMCGGALTLLTDFLVLVMPMPLVWRLQVSRKQRVALSLIFMLGGFVCIASIIRLPNMQLLFTNDPLWTGYAPTIWSEVEVNLGIVCACLPTLRPVASKLGRLPVLNHVFSVTRVDTGSNRLRPSYGVTSNASHKRSWLGSKSIPLASSNHDDPHENAKSPFERVDSTTSITSFSKDEEAPATNAPETPPAEETLQTPSQATLHPPTSTVMSTSTPGAQNLVGQNG